MAQRGNKKNAQLNGEWGKHVRGFDKKYTSSLRRQAGREEICQILNEGSLKEEYDALSARHISG